MEGKVKPDSPWVYAYSKGVVDYESWDISIDDHEQVMVLISRTKRYPKKGRMKPMLQFKQTGRLEWLKYVTCFDPHEITADLFWKWLEETCDIYYEYYNDLLKEFYERTNIVSADDVDKDDYDDPSRRHYQYISFFKRIRDYAKSQGNKR